MNLHRKRAVPSLALVLALVLAFMLALAVSTHSAAQSYPSRPIKLLVPLAAGSTADIMSRSIASELTRSMGQQVIVENKPAAGGTVAMVEVARAAPDGYTIGFASQGTLVFNPAIYAKPGYDSLKDFAPIIFGGSVSNVMVVPPGSTAKTALDVVAAAKAKPGMTYSSGGNGTSHHLSGVLFGQLMGIELLHVPYKGAPQGVMAVMSGEVNMGFFNTPTVISQIRAQKLKALGVTSLKRSVLLPELPTLDASGVTGYEVSTWFGFVAPAGTAPELITRLHSEIGKILALPEVREKLVAQGFDLVPLQPSAAFAQLIRDDTAKWPAIIKASGATVD